MASLIEAAHVWLRLCLSHDVIVIVSILGLSLMSLRMLVVTLSDQDLELVRLGNPRLPQHKRCLGPGSAAASKESLEIEAACGLGGV